MFLTHSDGAPDARADRSTDLCAADASNEPEQLYCSGSCSEHLVRDGMAPGAANLLIYRYEHAGALAGDSLCDTGREPPRAFFYRLL